MHMELTITEAFSGKVPGSFALPFNIFQTAKEHRDANGVYEVGNRLTGHSRERKPNGKHMVCDRRKAGFDQRADKAGYDSPLLQISSQTCLYEGAGNNRVCHFSRRACCNRNRCNNRLPSQAPGALECDSRWYLIALMGRYLLYLDRIHGTSGQSSVEYAIILAAFLVVIAACGLLMNALTDGLFIEHAISAASHNAQVLFGGAADVFSF